MAANIVSRFLQVLIGADSQDWSTAVDTLVVGRDSLGESGVLANTATLTLQQNLLNPESLDPWLNPSRWRPGNAVQVNIHNASQSYVAHPQGHLYILEEPTFDRISGQLSLALGCWLTWADSQEPADDVSAVTLGTATDLSVVCQRYLEAAGIPAASISLSGPWGYTTAKPVPKPSGSYVALAGEIAYAAGFRYLYTNPSGVVQAAALDTDTATAAVTVTLGENEVRYDDLSDPQEPAEVVRVAGNGCIVELIPTPQTDREFDSDSSTFTSESYSLTPVTLGGVECVRRFTETKFEQDGGLVIEFADSPNSKAVVDDTHEVRYYEIGDGPPYLLKRIERRTDKARGIINPKTGSDFPERVSNVTIDYYRDEKGRITSIVEEEEAAEVIYDRESESPYNKRTVRIKTQRWKEVGTDNFEYFEREKLARIAWQRNVGANGGDPWFLTQPRPAIFRPATGSGENAPPSTDDWEGPHSESEETYEGEAEWQHRGGASGRSRKRMFQLPEGLGLSHGQCAAIAALHRDLLEGRKRGKLIQIPITDTLLGVDAPLMRLDVVDGMRTYQFLADVVTWEHQSDRAFVECAGILIGDPLYPKFRPGSAALSIGVDNATLVGFGTVTLAVDSAALTLLVDVPIMAAAFAVDSAVLTLGVDDPAILQTEFLPVASAALTLGVGDLTFKELAAFPVASAVLALGVADITLTGSGTGTFAVDSAPLALGVTDATLAGSGTVTLAVDSAPLALGVEAPAFNTAFQFVDASIDAEGNRYISKVIDAPANADGDFLIAFVYSEAESITPPAGWTFEANYFTLGVGGRDSLCHVYTKIASSEPAQYTWTNSTNERMAIALLSFRGPSGIANAITNTGAGSSIAVTGTGGFNVYLGTWVFTNSTETATVTGTDVTAIHSPTNGNDSNLFAGGYSSAGTTVTITHTNTATVLPPNIGAIALELN